MKAQRRVDGYIRVSRVGGREGDSFISPAVQRERIEGAAAAANAVVVEWHEDLDQSGGRNDRPGFQAALERVEAGETDGIVVAKLDRFARSVLHAREALKRIEAAGGSLISAEDGFDSSTSMGKFATTMLFALGELELDRVRENWTTARVYAVKRGVHMAKALTGYSHDADGVLVPNADAPAIQEMFRRRAAGANLSELARQLDARGVRPSARKTDAGRWNAASVRSLLRNPGYLGQVRAADVINENAHPALVSLREFEAANEARGVSSGRSSEPALLAGLLRCAACRHALKPKKAPGSKGRVYVCSKNHGSGTCPQPASVYATVAEPYVVDLLLGDQGDALLRPRPLTHDIEEAEREVEVQRAELNAWATDTAIMSIGRDVFLEGLRARQDRVDEAEARRRELFAADGAALPAASDLASLWPTLGLGEQRRILSAVFDAIVVLPNGRRPVSERLVPIAHGDGPSDLPGRGKRVPFRPFDLPAETRMAVA